MNHKLLFSLACVLLFFSCKKSHHDAPQPEPVRYPVRVDVSDFTQTQEIVNGTNVKTNALKSNTTADTIPVNQLWYYVYDTSQPANLITMRTANKGSSDFGVFKDNLAAGNYNVYLWGSSINLNAGGFNNATSLSFYPTATGWGDTFFKSIPITVTSAGVDQSATLTRVSAQLVLNIEDAIPASVTKLELKYDEYFSISSPIGNLNYKNYNGQCIVSKLLTAADAGKTNFRLYANTLNTQTPVNVSISFYSTGTSPDDTKTLSVTCQPNKRTIITGKLFTGNNTFTVSYTDWNPNVNIGF